MQNLQKFTLAFEIFTRYNQYIGELKDEFI